MKINFKFNLIILILIILICNFIITFFPSNLILKYIPIVLLFLVFIILPTKYALYNCYFIIPFINMFDNTGFTFTFNFCMIITFVKLILKYKTMNKALSIFVVLIGIMELFLAFIYGNIDFNIITFLSLIISYMLLILCLTNFNEFRFKNIFISLFLGFLLSSIIAIINQIVVFGKFNLLYYRFMGMFRDPNYYSFFALLLAFSSYKIIKKSNPKMNYYFIICILLGMLSSSKMFLLCCAGGLLLKIFKIFDLRKIKRNITKRNILMTIPIVFVSILLISNLNRINFVQSIFTNYQYRFKTQDLTTGRMDLSKMYVDAIIANPNYLIFGASNTYYNFEIINKVREQGIYVSTNATAHNTYLDLVLSWGIVGTVIFVYFIICCIKMVLKKYNYKSLNINYNNFVFISIVLLCLFSLSFLSADCFVLIIYFCISKVFYNENKGEII